MSKYWGYHLMLDCARCDISAVTDPDNIKRFVDELVVTIDMIPYGDTNVVHFATHSEDKAGWSFFQMIETSNISGHMVDHNGDGYIDIFSCKPFDIGLVEDTVNKYFRPESIRVNYITRHAD
jgi:S-adenosylmethionine decarboxylase